MAAGTRLHPARDRVPSRWLDISRPLADSTPAWPGDAAFRRVEEVTEGVTVSRLTASCHVGTHLEGPRHVAATAAALETLALERLIGPAEVIVPDAEGGLILPAGFKRGWAPRAPRLLLRTDSHPLGCAIGPGFTAVAADTVTWLADRGVDLVGVDTPSVDPFASTELAAHRALAERGMVWLEGLALFDVEPGLYFLAALPLPLLGAEASPARAVLGAWD